MPSIEEVQSQLKKLDGISSLLGRKEIKELPGILWEDETVEALVQGIYENGLGILVATNKRLVFIDKGLLWGLRVEDFPYDKITSIQYETGLLFGKITIFASGNRAVIDQTNKKIAKNFCDYARARISSKKEHASIATGTAGTNYINELEKLAELKEKGILTEKEFLQKKKEILNKV